MKTRMFSLSAASLFLATVATLCNGAPAPKPPPPKERTTLRTGGCDWIAFSPDGKMLASACYDKTIKLWDVAKGKEIATLSGHAAAVTALAFSPDGKYLVSNSADNTLRLWDVAKRKRLAVLDERWGESKNLIFSPDSKTFIGGSNYVDFWDLHTKKRSKRVKLPIDSSQYLFPQPSLGYDADGRLLTVLWPRDPRKVEVWDVLAGKCLRALEYPEKGDYRGSIAFSPDYKILASVWHGPCLWDIISGKRLGCYEHPREITCIAFGANGRMLAVAWRRNTGKPAPFDRERVISLLDPATGKELAILEKHTGDIAHLAFSPDGKILASASGMDRTIKLWDIRGVKAPKKKK